MDRIPPASPMHARDQGRDRARRLTWWAAAAATAVTAAGAGLAAVTVPGHTIDAQAQNSPSSPGDGSGSSSDGGFDPNSGTFSPPQAPAGGSSGPVFISGGS